MNNCSYANFKIINGFQVPHNPSQKTTIDSNIHSYADFKIVNGFQIIHTVERSCYGK